MGKPTGYGLAGWGWKPYTSGSATGGSARYHIFTKSGETYYQCLYRRSHFHPLLDDRSHEIPDSEVTQILDISESHPNHPTNNNSDKDN